MWAIDFDDGQIMVIAYLSLHLMLASYRTTVFVVVYFNEIRIMIQAILQLPRQVLVLAL